MKILPFDYDIAKTLQSPNRIESNGVEVEILTFDSGAKYEPIVGVWNKEFVRTYYKNGNPCGEYSKLVMVLYE